MRAIAEAFEHQEGIRIALALAGIQNPKMRRRITLFWKRSSGGGEAAPGLRRRPREGHPDRTGRPMVRSSSGVRPICFIVKDATRQALGYFYVEDEPALPRPAVVWTLTN